MREESKRLVTVKVNTTRVRAHLHADVGMVREHNEDSAWVDPDGNIFVVADGMGGHAAGEVASAMAVEGVRDALVAVRDRLRAFGDSATEEGRKEILNLLERPGVVAVRRRSRWAPAFAGATNCHCRL